MEASKPEIVVLVAAPERGPSLPIFVEVVQVGASWAVQMRGVVRAVAVGQTREDAQQAEWLTLSRPARLRQPSLLAGAA